MTASQLRHQLRNVPDDALVVIPGRDGIDWRNVAAVEKLLVAPHYTVGSYDQWADWREEDGDTRTAVGIR